MNACLSGYFAFEQLNLNGFHGKIKYNIRQRDEELCDAFVFAVHMVTSFEFHGCHQAYWSYSNSIHMVFSRHIRSIKLISELMQQTMINFGALLKFKHLPEFVCILAFCTKIILVGFCM